MLRIGGLQRERMRTEKVGGTHLGADTWNWDCEEVSVISHSMAKILIENHKHVHWILNYDNKVPRTAQGKRSVERCLFPLTFPNVSFSIHPNTVSNLSWFILSPLFNGVSKIRSNEDDVIPRRREKYNS